MFILITKQTIMNVLILQANRSFDFGIQCRVCYGYVVQYGHNKSFMYYLFIFSCRGANSSSSSKKTNLLFFGDK